MKNRKMNPAALAAALIGAAALFGVAGCDDGSSPKLCVCPDKIHGNAPCDCGGVDCVCEQKEWQLTYGTLTNETGNKLAGHEIGNINEALETLDDIYDGTVLNQLSIVLIGGDSATMDASKKLSLGINNLSNTASLWDIIDTYFYNIENNLNKPLISKILNSNIRLGNAKAPGAFFG
jgi:hypothetical protein